MARLLDALRPLTGLLRQTTDPVRAAHEFADAAAAVRAGRVLIVQLSAHITDTGLAGPVLACAGVLDVQAL